MASEPPERPRLLVLASTYPRWSGDPEPAFVHELARRLTDRFSVCVVAPHAAGAATRERMDGVEVVRYRYAPATLEVLVNDGGIVSNLRRRRWTWLLVPTFVLCQVLVAWREAWRMKPALVHAHWLLPQGLVAALLKVIAPGQPHFVVTSHGADLFALRSPLAASVKRLVLRHASAVTVVSRAMCEEVIALGRMNTGMFVEPMGVDLHERFTPPPSEGRSRREILFVGRLVEKKGVGVLLDALPTVLDRHPDAFATIVGFGPERQALELHARHLGVAAHVQFVGAVQQQDLPDYYRRAAVFVAPFLQASTGDREGLGLVAVEAAGCGCPLVLGDLPTVREPFDSKSDARFVQPGDASGLAAACIEVLDAPEQAAEGALELRGRLLARFDWSARARAYADLFERYLSVTS